MTKTVFDFNEIHDDFYPVEGYEYSEQERQYLRPIAETLCLIAAEPYFKKDDLPYAHWENWLPTAYALFNMYGGKEGQPGYMSFVRSSEPLVHPYLIKCTKEACADLGWAALAAAAFLTFINYVLAVFG